MWLWRPSENTIQSIYATYAFLYFPFEPNIKIAFWWIMNKADRDLYLSVVWK